MGKIQKREVPAGRGGCPQPPEGKGELVAQFNIPVSQVEEVAPGFRAVAGDLHIEEGAELGAFRFFHQLHAGLMGTTVALAGVAGDAGADHVFPRGRAALVPGDDVVKVKVLPILFVPAVLAGEGIPLKNVLAGQLHFLFGNPVKEISTDKNIPPDSTHVIPENEEPKLNLSTSKNDYRGRKNYDSFSFSADYRHQYHSVIGRTD